MPWWWWVAAAVALLVIGLGIWWWRRRQRTRAGPTGDPFADAEAAFERIERLGLVGAGEPGRHAALMADVLRRYLAARVTGASLALTSRELLDALRGAPTVSLERIQRVFDTVDPVKFAAAPIGAEQARSVGAEARAIVRAEHEQAERIAAATAANVPGKVAA
jgi:hypothetical protein